MLHIKPHMIRGNAALQQVQPEPHSVQCAVHTVVTL